MFNKETIFKAVTDVGGKAYEFGKSAADLGSSTITTAYDAAKEKIVGGETNVDPIVADLLQAVVETKPEFLGTRFKEVLERYI